MYSESGGNPTHDPWDRLYGPVRTLLLGMLRINASKRYTIKRVLRDEWYKRPNALMINGLVKDPGQLAARIMENVNDSTEAPVVAYSQPLNTGRVQQSQSLSLMFAARNFASSQPTRNNERASDSNLGTRIGISWQDEALELSQPVNKKAAFNDTEMLLQLYLLSMEELTVWHCCCCCFARDHDSRPHNSQRQRSWKFSRLNA